MNNNDILKRLRYALSLNDANVINIFKTANYNISQTELTNYLKKEEEEGFVECEDDVFDLFLTGLIEVKRGKQENQTTPSNYRLTNNVILRKMRIALELKDVDMLELLKLGDMTMSKSELSALFRNETHPNFKPCGDQLIRNFLKGLTVKLRPKEEKLIIKK